MWCTLNIFRDIVEQKQANFLYRSTDAAHCVPLQTERLESHSGYNTPQTPAERSNVGGPASSDSGQKWC